MGVCQNLHGYLWAPKGWHPCKQTLKTRLAFRGYYQCQHTPGLWRHMWHDITFCLVANNFGIKTTSMANMKHLVSSLQEHYAIAVNWTGYLFCGVKLMWDYVNCKVGLHMPDYISKALLKFKYQHQVLSKPQHAPYKAT
jgi:hypothetical protein